MTNLRCTADCKVVHPQRRNLLAVGIHCCSRNVVFSCQLSALAGICPLKGGRAVIKRDQTCQGHISFACINDIEFRYVCCVLQCLRPAFAVHKNSRIDKSFVFKCNIFENNVFVRAVRDRHVRDHALIVDDHAWRLTVERSISRQVVIEVLKDKCIRAV